LNEFWVIGAVVLSLAPVPFAMAAEDTKVSVNDTGIGGQATDGKTDNHGEEIQLTAGYEKIPTNGFFIRSKDEEFRLNIGAYTQARFDINWRDAPVGDDDVEEGFSLNRTRIFLEGQFTPAFDYHFRVNIDDDSDFDLLVA
jgi:hypothetical protein